MNITHRVKVVKTNLKHTDKDLKGECPKCGDTTRYGQRLCGNCMVIYGMIGKYKISVR